MKYRIFRSGKSGYEISCDGKKIGSAKTVKDAQRKLKTLIKEK